MSRSAFFLWSWLSFFGLAVLARPGDRSTFIGCVGYALLPALLAALASFVLSPEKRSTYRGYLPAWIAGFVFYAMATLGNYLYR